jgi:hypothetical protein
MVQTRTRIGRQIKKPKFYTPDESVLEDDYTLEEHDSNLGSDNEDVEEIYSDEESEEDEDEDEGSLKDFIVDDDEESEEEDA